MSAEEFEEWSVMFNAEDLHPAAARIRHAQLLAALHNGPLTRKGKKLWLVTEFLRDPWSETLDAAPRRLTAAQVKEQVATINATWRGKRGH